jgi:hypothetical protein
VSDSEEFLATIIFKGKVKIYPPGIDFLIIRAIVLVGSKE